MVSIAKKRFDVVFGLSSYSLSARFSSGLAVNPVGFLVAPKIKNGQYQSGKSGIINRVLLKTTRFSPVSSSRNQ